MPLPAENIPWPPPELAAAYRVFTEWDTWYSGDPTALEEVYRDNSGVATEGKHRGWGFWTRRMPTTSTNARRERLHVPLPGDIAATSADMLFASPIDIVVPGVLADADEGAKGREDPTQSRIDEIMERGGLHNRLLEAAEEAAAYGAVYLRPTWNTDVAGHPILTHVTPDRAVPTFRYGILTEVTFTKTLSEPDEAKVWRHLEHHYTDDGRAVIENALYVGTEEKIGMRVELDHHPWTAGLEETIRLPVAGLAVRYVKNMGPARRLRGTPHGRSDFDGIEPLFDAVDEAWNSWMRDLRLGKARLIVPADYLERGGPGRGAFFDIDQELFTPLEMDPTQVEGAGITNVQFSIRYAEHKATVEALVAEAVGKAGYSAQTFGLHGEGPEITATEVRARTSKTWRTTAKKQRYWEAAIEDVMEIMLAIDKEMLNTRGIDVIRPDVEWPDPESADTRRVAEIVQMLSNAEAASTETLVRMQHPDWSDSEVLAEVEKILDGKPKPLPNPFDFGPETIPDMPANGDLIEAVTEGEEPGP